MKKKSDGSDVITKDYLDSALDGLRGEFTDFKEEMKGEFVDFKEEMKGEFIDFKGEMKGEFTDFKEKMKDESANLRGDFVVFGKSIREELNETITAAMSKIFTRIDPLLSELEDRRLDRDLTTEQLRNLDKRVIKLENPN